ncbi:hypothetical protein ACFOPN_17595 [Xanthomonas hyacinthi]|nr:hypothetical protein [Xanthomonas hyacinthi]
MAEPLQLIEQSVAGVSGVQMAKMHIDFGIESLLVATVVRLAV